MADVLQENRQIVQGYLDAWISGDAEKGKSYFADDVVAYVSGTHHLSGTYHGVDDIMTRYIEPVVAMTEGNWAVVSVEDVLSSETRAIAMVTERFQRPGREPLESERLAIYDIEDGKIVRLSAYERDQAAVDAYFSEG
jgi:ketosteroid isomerase-like protein